MRVISSYVRRCLAPSWLLTAALCSTGAIAQTLVHFDLPAQPLAQSLNAIASATNTDVGFSAADVAGLLAPPLKADLTVDAALSRVLAGTGLRLKHLNGHAIVIAAANSSAIENSSPLRLAQAASPPPTPRR